MTFLRCCMVLVIVSQVVQCQRLLLAGGGVADNNYEIWDKVVEMSGGATARIGVVTAASADPLDSWNFYGPLFLERGAAETYWIPIHLLNTSAAYDPDVVANIDRMTGFFFGGGDQARIVATFYEEGHIDTPALAAMRSRYAANPDHMIGGTSAGTVAVVSAPMIMDGYSYEALRFGAYDHEGIAPQYTVIYDADGGLRFMDNFIVDSHFSERGREGRLTRLISDTFLNPNISRGVSFGIGIDEDTALAVYNANTPTAYAEVISNAGAVFIDTTESTVDDSGVYWRINDVIFHYFTRGDVINLIDFTVTYSADKVNILGQESLQNPPTSDDVFYGAKNLGKPAEFTGCATGIYDTADVFSTTGVTIETGPQFQVNFLQTDPRAEAYIGTSSNQISYRYLMVNMRVATNMQ